MSAFPNEPAPLPTITGEGAVEVMMLAEMTGLLLGCLRNYRRTGDRVDLDGALSLEPKVAAALTKVRGRMPRPG